MDRPNRPPSKFAEFGSRLFSQWQLKLFGVPVFIAVFFVGYFAVLRFPLFEVTYMPVTALDYAIPYDPMALAVYLSLWFYVSLAPALLRSRQELMAHCRAAGMMGVIGLGTFFFWPTAVPEGAGLHPADAAALAWLKQLDAAGNACPSLHVAFAVFAALGINRVFGEMRLPLVFKLLNVGWCGAIAYSTLATKQHVWIDAVAGGLLGWVVGTLEARSSVGGRDLVSSLPGERAAPPARRTG